MTVMCCECKRIRNNNEWIDVHEPIEGPISHGYCPVCFEKCWASWFNESAPPIISTKEDILIRLARSLA